MAEEITVWWATKIEKQILDHRMRIEKLEKNPIVRGHKHDEVGRIVWVVGDGPFPEKLKPHTCGDCRHPWRKEEFGGQPDPEMLICFVRHNPNFRCRSRFDTACDKFEPRGE